MNLRLPVSLLAILFAATPAAAEPRFADYPAKTKLSGEPVLPDMTGDAGSFRTRIRNGMAEGPNFGGHFSIIEIGCGTSCIIALLIDASDGQMIDFPLGGESNYQLQLKYDVESTLLQADWMDTDVGDYDTCIRNFYDIASGALVEISTRTYTVERGGICE